MSAKKIIGSAPGLRRFPSKATAAMLALADGGAFKIDEATAIRRTKKMIAWDTGLNYGQISTSQDLAVDLNYSDSNKQDLKGPIDSYWFADVEANASAADLKKATTVGDLASRIFNKYVPAIYRM